MNRPYNIYGHFVERLRELRQRYSRMPDVLQLIPKAIALIPLSILEYLHSKGLLFSAGAGGILSTDACVCINYYSRIAPGQRFDIPLDNDRRLRTFCLNRSGKSRTAASSGKLEDLYDVDDVFVRLLDCFYESDAVNEQSFSMKAYIEHLPENTRRKRTYYTIKEKEYGGQADLSSWLSRSFPLEGYKYDSYARFFQAAAGLKTDGKEASYREWEAGINHKIWETRHSGKLFCQYNIPVSDVDGRIIANIMIPCLLSQNNEESFDNEIYHIAQEAGHCVREIWLYESSARLKETAVRLAASSVMSRNLSHNFGSHVLSKISQPDDPSVFQIGEDDPYKAQFEYLVDGKDASNDPFRQVAWFNAYLRRRMDYISDVAYSPPSFLTVRWVKKDLFYEFDRTRLMLNHISGLERNFRFGLSMEFEGEQEDLPIAVPNDVIGSQAFFNIIENVIRNVAKHSHKHLVKNLFTLRFSKPDPREPGTEGLYRVRIFHNLPMTHSEAEAYRQTMDAHIENDVIDKRDGSLRGEALGVIEMKVSAAVLRQVDTKMVSSDYPCTPSLLKAIAVPAKKKKERYYVGYEFYMMEPREIMLITQDRLEEFRSSLEHGDVCNYDFLVFDGVDDPQIAKLVNRFSTALPLRILRKTDLGPSPVNASACWETWARLQTKGEKWLIQTFETSMKRGAEKNSAVLLSHRETFVNLSGESAGMPPYWECLSGKAKEFLPDFASVGDLSSYSTKLCRETLPCNSYSQCLEMVNTRVFVVDERIQDVAFDKKRYGIPFIDHFQATGIECPARKEVDLRASPFDEEVCDRFLRMVDSRVDDMDFIIIHYGLLERVFKTRETLEKNWFSLMKDQLELWSHRRAQLVVESGRGVPRGLPEVVRFLSNASVEAALVEFKSKALLTALLYSSRKAKL